MKTLIVYYSWSGWTRLVAVALAGELGADIEEIRCGRYSPGFWGRMRAILDGWQGDLPQIEPLSHLPSSYDLVVIGGPIWVFRPATPLQSFLRQESSKLPEVAFFLTHGGSAGKQSLREMQTLAGKAPVGTIVIRDIDIKNGTFVRAVSSFAESLRGSKESPSLPTRKPAVTSVKI